MEAPKVPVALEALEALYVAEKSYGARPVSGFADAPGRRDDIVAYADNSNLVTKYTEKKHNKKIGLRSKRNSKYKM